MRRGAIEMDREPERQYGLSLRQVLTPFLMFAAVLAIGLLVTMR